MINKIISIDEAADMVKEDMTIMVGGEKDGRS
jgi:acyl CoA:acetate/3-ketoacid CoA transferase alpha subunit